MNYAHLLAWTLISALATGTVWGWIRLARILDAFEARMEKRIDAAVPESGGVKVQVVGDPQQLQKVVDSARERAGRSA